MTRTSNIPAGVPTSETVSCEVCMKEIPLSEAIVPEAGDYVAHFCGMECYTKWKRQGDQAKLQRAPTATR